jgi:AraC-like DNA-binding protein
MATRLMVNADGKTRPLSFGSADPAVPLLRSSSTDWAGLPFEIHRVGETHDLELVHSIEGDHGLWVVMEGRLERVLRESDREQVHIATVGMMSLVSTDQRDDIAQLGGDATVLALRLPREWWRRLAMEGAPDEFAFAETWTRDETIHGFALAMWREVARNASTGPLFAESISLALLSYLAARLPASERHRRGRLTDAQARIVSDYILEQLHAELSVMGLASLVGLGPRRFSTLFRQTFGTTPHRYIVERRLREGARLLENGHDIAEVARRVGFCSQSHFTAAFREGFGITPRRYVRHPRMAQTG